MIHTLYARVEPAEWGCTVAFADGAATPAQHWPDDPHYRVIAHRAGYQDDTLAYCREHEVAHLVVEEVLHDRPSRVLWGLAHGCPLTPFDAAYEEIAAQALQRFARAAERPIVGGVDWDALKARFLEVLECST